jgi:hypothetical protein
MSLASEYRKTIKEKLGLKEEDPAMVGSPSAANPADQMGDVGSLDEGTLNSILELLTREIAKREAVGEPEVDTAAPGVDPQAQVTPAPQASDMNEAEMLADDVFFEMLNSFKNNIANCEDSNRKNMLRKSYELCYKMRDKFIKEMTAPEEQPAAVPTK